LCCFVFVAGSASAQTELPPVPPGPLTLEQVLDLAQARSESLAIARQGVERAGHELSRVRSGLLPQLSVTAAYDRSLASEFEGVFEGFGDTDGTPGEPGDAGGTLDDLPFGRENTWRVALSLSQSLYSGGRIPAQSALAEAGRQSAAIALTTAEAQLLFDVTQAYYDAALSDRLVAIAEAALGQATATLQQAEAAFEAGTQPEFEVLRARVSRDTQNPVIIRQRVNRELALLRLKQMLDLPPGADLRLADALASGTLPPPPVFAARVAAVESSLGVEDPVRATLQLDGPLPPDRAPVQDAAAAVSLREAALRLTRAERLPSVFLTSNYGRVAYPAGTFPTSNDFRTNWTIGAVVQVPILTGGRLRAEARIAEAHLEEARLRLRQVDELAALDTRSAWAELLAARAAWDATSGTVDQAFRAYEIAEVRYQAGVSTQLELSDSRLLLQQAEANRALAARDLQIARARVALLPDLPLGTAAPGVVPQAPAVPASPPPDQPQSPAGGGSITSASSWVGAQPSGGTP
jgi:outer membrane protein TolC